MSTKNYRSSTIRGKLRVCRYLSANPSLRANVPHTVSFSLSNLRRMAGSHASLYIKPDIGSLGIGIFKLNRMKSGYELLASSGKRRRLLFGSLPPLYRHIKARSKSALIIQRTVRLDRTGGRPYDIRVMVQRKPGSGWHCTGMMVKVGAKGRIVTNYYQGGKVIGIGRLMRQKGLSAQVARTREKRLSAKALTIARTLSARRSGMHEIGVDFAGSGSGRLWILEVNSNHPQFHPMKWLDRAAYNRMLSYAKSYGRYSAR